MATAEIDRCRRLGSLWIAPGQAEQAILERSIIGDLDPRRESAVLPPLVGDRAELVPQTLHQLRRQGRIDPDHLRDALSPHPPEASALNQIVARSKATERCVDGQLQ